MQPIRPSFSATIILFFILFFIWASVLGMGISMTTDAHGHMTQCQLINGLGSICTLTIFAHISAWQNIFTAVIPTGAFAALIIFIVTIAFPVLAVRDGLETDDAGFLFQDGNFVPFDPLRLAFSRGILHPKIYRINLGS